MISVENAINLVAQQAAELFELTDRAETVALVDGLGRILSRPVQASLSLPSFDNAAMDGFALRWQEIKFASQSSPVRLHIKGEVRAGQPPIECDAAQVAIRIMTGAPLPVGFDTVVKKEDVIETDKQIVLAHALDQGCHVRKSGEDINRGELAAEQGTTLTPAVMGFLASVGTTEVTVARKPRVSILVTGDELVSSMAQLSPGKIFDSNAVMLANSLQQLRIPPYRLERVGDSPQRLHESVSVALQEADVVVISGGVSVGEHDYTKKVLQSLGVDQLFWRVAQKPGKPLYLGRKDSVLVMGLPGNPYSVFVCFWLYLYPLFMGLMGARDCALKRSRERLAQPLPLNRERDQFLKGRVLSNNGETIVEPLGRQASHLLSSLAHADVLLHVPAASETKAGDTVEVIHLYGGGLCR